jgi:hypothetical protein
LKENSFYSKDGNGRTTHQTFGTKKNPEVAFRVFQERKEKGNINVYFDLGCPDPRMSGREHWKIQHEKHDFLLHSHWAHFVESRLAALSLTAAFPREAVQPNGAPNGEYRTVTFQKPKGRRSAVLDGIVPGKPEQTQSGKKICPNFGAPRLMKRCQLAPAVGERQSDRHFGAIPLKAGGQIRNGYFCWHLVGRRSVLSAVVLSCFFPLDWKKREERIHSDLASQNVSSLLDRFRQGEFAELAPASPRE